MGKILGLRGIFYPYAIAVVFAKVRQLRVDFLNTREGQP